MLALDTSGPTARVAIVDNTGRSLAAGERVSDRHSTTLLPLCHELLTQVGIGVSGLGAVLCGSGPGSFTGLRVGLAVAKGFALAHDLPLVLVPSLAALALDLAGTPGSALLAPCIDAGKGEIYAQLHRRTDPFPTSLTSELRLDPDRLVAEARATGEPVIFAGTGADRYADRLAALMGPAAVQIGFPGPSAGAIAKLALARLGKGEHDDLGTAVPVYGRAPDITMPKRPV